MKVHDAFVGAVFLGAGVFVALYAQSLTPPRHLAYGPGFFPTLIGTGMALTGGAIIITALRAGSADQWVVKPDWWGSAGASLRFWAIPAAIIFYYLVAGTLGFLATAAIILTALTFINGARISIAALVGVVSAVILNIVFASILHVPLPWGPLRSISGWFIW
jgi:putative tricarboxylic transport membrane protein